jgi:WXXGXW repeat (2 copies)
MKNLRHSWIAAAALAGALWTAPASAARVYISIVPPAPIAEVRVAAPGTGDVWVGGFHRWDGKAYVWVPGRWALPPHGRVAWVPGHWKHHAHGWYWVEGHWK